VNENIQNLLEKYHRGDCTPDELRRLEAWYIRIGQGAHGIEPDKETVERMLARLHHLTDSQRPTPRRRLPANLYRFAPMAAAAAILVFLGVVLFVRQDLMPNGVTSVMDIPAGKDQAFLTLSDGKKIALNDATDGTVAEQHGIQIQKRDDGTVVYVATADTGQRNYATSYNTIETPRGGQYQVILPDGTTVWLNASSSITFPVHFPDSIRSVRMSGEAYFDVTTQYAANGGKHIPFTVYTNKQKVEVLGTKFNVNTYPENDMQRTTLVEGKVKVVLLENGEQATLLPGQRTEADKHIQIEQADLEMEIAWKNGDFIFKNERLPHILLQVARWYDIEVDCPPELQTLTFSGMVSRKRPLSSIITMLKSTGSLQVELKERRLTVKK